jgi:CRP-like cAMP-binding protein
MMKRQSFEAGEVIFREGEASDAAYLIVSGEVEVLRESADGPAETVAVLKPGEYFGEMGAIDDKPRSASTRARGPVVVMSVDQAAFMDMLLNRPKDSIELLRVLFARLRSANDRLMELEKGAGRAKLDARLQAEAKTK